MSSHPLFLLVFATLIVLLGFLGWSKLSTKRSQETGGNTSGIGGPNDPISGHVHLSDQNDQ